MAQQHRSRGLIGGVIASGVLAVAALTVGTLALTGVFGAGAVPVNATEQQPIRQYQYGAPWAEGERIGPVSTDEPKIRSVVRAQQFEQAWSAMAPRDERGSTGQLQPELNFDPYLEVGEQAKPTASLVAGLTVYRHDGSDIDVRIEEYTDPADATARLAEFREPLTGDPLALLPIDGADDVEMMRTWCNEGDERTTKMSLSALVEGTIRVTLNDQCTISEDEGARMKGMKELAASAVAVARQVYATPIPRAWMDRAADLPIVAGGTWRAEQVAITDREDGLDLDDTLPAPFAGAGVELMVRAADEIYQLGTEEQAIAVMTTLQREPDRGDRSEWADIQDRTGDQDEVCGTGIHWQQGTVCWIRTGKYIVVAHGEGHQDRTSEPIDRTQAQLLEGH